MIDYFVEEVLRFIIFICKIDALIKNLKFLKIIYFKGTFMTFCFICFLKSLNSFD